MTRSVSILYCVDLRSLLLKFVAPYLRRRSSMQSALSSLRSRQRLPDHVLLMTLGVIAVTCFGIVIWLETLIRASQYIRTQNNNGMTLIRNSVCAQAPRILDRKASPRSLYRPGLSPARGDP
ncbi:hypothetical protein OE88DRAFT_1797965 [Heliocybe sulcata]|uniref:Uncharacterized protein n=1 Tax=Heliocybe sulcata TaxID=5364 RepID=A0A5C3N3A0_9AGAM|nr:hypothetical protein OE88DRAFT_1797965 [Heliocybe sulcata]